MKASVSVTESVRILTLAADNLLPHVIDDNCHIPHSRVLALMEKGLLKGTLACQAPAPAVKNVTITPEGRHFLTRQIRRHSRHSFFHHLMSSTLGAWRWKRQNAPI